jgi:hypothetical protein
MMQGCRGIVFRSTTRLDATDAATRRRAAALALLNRQLQVAAPWMAAGSPAGELLSSDGTAAAGMLYVDGAHLRIYNTSRPYAAQGQSRVETPPTRKLPPALAAYTVPGIPDASQAWTLTPDALRPLNMKRVAGGMRIVVDSPPDAMVVITQDPHAIANLKLTAARDGAAALRIARDLAAMKSSAIAERAKQFAEFGYASRDAEQIASQAATALRQADVYLAAGRLDMAYAQIQIVSSRLSEFSHQQSNVVRGRQLGINSPLLLADDTLPVLLRMIRGAELLIRGENQLGGGDFENLEHLTQLGWQHLHDPNAKVATNAELSGAQPQAGQ